MLSCALVKSVVDVQLYVVDLGRTVPRLCQSAEIPPRLVVDLKDDGTPALTDDI